MARGAELVGGRGLAEVGGTHIRQVRIQAAGPARGRYGGRQRGKGFGEQGPAAAGERGVGADINDIAAGAGGGRPVGGEVIGIRRVGEEPRGRGRAGRRLHRAGRGAIGEVVHARPGAIVFVDAHPIGGIGLQTGHRHVGAGAIVDDLAVVGLVVGGREVAVHA